MCELRLCGVNPGFGAGRGGGGLGDVRGCPREPFLLGKCRESHAELRQCGLTQNRSALPGDSETVSEPWALIETETGVPGTIRREGRSGRDLLDFFSDGLWAWKYPSLYPSCLGSETRLAWDSLGGILPDGGIRDSLWVGGKGSIFLFVMKFTVNHQVTETERG